MAKPKKNEKTAELQISVQQFSRTRDSVVTGLTNLQNAVSQLLHSYVAHTNTVLGGGSVSALDTLAISNPLAAASNSNGLSEKEKKKRAKKERDPNAPRRPLTAFFLYAKHARDFIKGDLAEDAKPGKIAEEAISRWNSMSPEEQQPWKDHYRTELEKWKVDMKAYQDSVGAEKVDSSALMPVDEDASEQHNLSDTEVALASDAEEAEEADEVDEDDEAESSPSSSPKPQTPSIPLPQTAVKSTKTSKRRKSDHENETAATVPVPVPVTVPSSMRTKATHVPLPGAAATTSWEHVEKSNSDKRKKKESQDRSVEVAKKKRNRKSTMIEEGNMSLDIKEPATHPPEKKKRKRKGESGVV